MGKRHPFERDDLQKAPSPPRCVIWSDLKTKTLVFVAAGVSIIQ